MKKRILLFIASICIFLYAKSSDTISVNYNFLELDSIPKGYFCLVLNSSSIRAKYIITFNNQIAFVDFQKSNYYRSKRKYLKIYGENYRAFILLKLDSNIKVNDFLNIEVIRKRKIGEKRMYTNIIYYGKYNYLLLYNPDRNKGRILYYLWQNFIMRRYAK